jgi:hypothetical protein
MDLDIGSADMRTRWPASSTGSSAPILGLIAASWPTLDPRTAGAFSDRRRKLACPQSIGPPGAFFLGRLYRLSAVGNMRL